MIAFIVIISVVLTTVKSLAATEIKWTTVAPSPVGTGEAMSAVVSGKLYQLGGYTSKWRPTNRADVYDPATNTWKRLADIPIRITHAGVAADAGNIYLAGGYVGKPEGGQLFATRKVLRYNIATNTWSEMPPLPQTRGSGGFSNLKRELHFFGGADLNRIDRGDHWILKLDNIAAGWQTAAVLPNPRSHLGDAIVNGKIYAIGGQHSYDDYLTTQNSVHVWNPATKQWAKVANLPQPRSHIGAATFVINGEIYLVGGEVKHKSAVNKVTVYNPKTNSWRELTPLPTKRHSGVGGFINGSIYYSSGAPAFDKTVYRGRFQFVS
ncbi:Kelch repeat-containing protein [Gloeocapsa sp. PCC 7428]|uniref:Kelch repeat-containing protein n=1 Tax=Gloeocapsa sp. PCC 7428 TaxID=1173026 RepID=UPI0002DF2307|nr:kelch repeat-containing protein [Gloeocapsa sp. PCC 7428]